MHYHDKIVIYDLGGGGGGGDIYVTGVTIGSGSMTFMRNGAPDLIVPLAIEDLSDADGDTFIRFNEAANDSMDFVVDGNVQMTISDGKLTLNGLFIDPPIAMEFDPQPSVPIVSGSDPNNTLWINSSNGHLYRGSVDVEEFAGTASDVPVVPAGNLTSTDVQAALLELQADIDSIVGGGVPTSAIMVSFSPFGFATATNVQSAMEQIVTHATGLATDVAALISLSHPAATVGSAPSGLIINPATQVVDLSLMAGDISLVPMSPLIATDTQTGFDEIANYLNALIASVGTLTGLAHQAVTLGTVPAGVAISPTQVLDISLTASDIANVPSGNLVSTDVQSALNELQADIDTIIGGSADGNGMFSPSNNAGVWQVTSFSTNVSPTTVTVGGFLDFQDSGTGNRIRLGSRERVSLSAPIVDIRDETGFAPSLSPRLRLYTSFSSGANYIELKSPPSLSGNTNYTLPLSDGVSGHALVTDGSGNLSWQDVTSPPFTSLSAGDVTLVPPINAQTDLYTAIDGLYGFIAGLPSGIDDVLSVGQSLTTNRLIPLDGNSLTMQDGSNYFIFRDTGGWEFFAQGLTAGGDTMFNATSDGIMLRVADTNAYHQITDNVTFPFGQYFHSFGAFWSRFLPTGGNPTHPVHFFSSTGHSVFIQGSGIGSSISNSHGYSLPEVQGSAGTVLTNDGAGVLSWGSPALSYGIDDTLAVGQTLTADRSTNLGANDWQILSGSLFVNMIGSASDQRFVVQNTANAGRESELFVGEDSAMIGVGGTSGSYDAAFRSQFQGGAFFNTILAEHTDVSPSSGSSTHPLRFVSSSGGHTWISARSGHVPANNHGYTLPVTQGLAGQQLENDGAGNLYWDNASDKRIKRRISDVDNALQKVLSIQLKRYHFLGEPDRIQYGFIAQQVRDVLPELVSKRAGKQPWRDKVFEDLLTLDKKSIVALLFGAVQEIHERLVKLEGQPL